MKQVITQCGKTIHLPETPVEYCVRDVSLVLRKVRETFGTVSDTAAIETAMRSDWTPFRQIGWVGNGTIDWLRWCVTNNVFASTELRRPNGYKCVSFLILLRTACEHVAQADYLKWEQEHDQQIAEIIAGTWKRLIAELGEQGAKDKMRTLYADAIQRDETGWLKQILNNAFKIATK